MRVFARQRTLSRASGLLCSCLLVLAALAPTPTAAAKYLENEEGGVDFILGFNCSFLVSSSPTVRQVLQRILNTTAREVTIAGITERSDDRQLVVSALKLDGKSIDDIAFTVLAQAASPTSELRTVIDPLGFLGLEDVDVTTRPPALGSKQDLAATYLDALKLIAIIAACLGLLYFGARRVWDRAENTVIVTVLLTVLDIFTDVAFAVTAVGASTSQLTTIGYWSIAFLIFPLVLNLILVIRILRFEFREQAFFDNWARHEMVAGVIVFGSITNVDLLSLLSSYLFHAQVLDFPVSSVTRDWLPVWSLVSNVFQNVPQLVLQYRYGESGGDFTNPMVRLAIASSISMLAFGGIRKIRKLKALRSRTKA